MNYFIKQIHINQLFHLNDIDIPIADEKSPHLLITGKNGSGKTVLMNAISDFFDIIKNDTSLQFMRYEKILDNYNNQLQRATSQEDKIRNQKKIDYYTSQLNKLYGRIELSLNNIVEIVDKYNKGKFIIAFYQADRKVKMDEPKNPTKPQYNKKGMVKETATSQFLNFLSDLKIQEALARNENQSKDADAIKAWFEGFEDLLKQIFQDGELKLEFNYRDYSFKICTEGKRFKFTEVSDGFAAVIDVVADLILKMQDDKSLSRIYQKEGIVLIDELETHLHLELQRVIMPLLTKVFPNIQFIVTTHSPFVLSSMPNAVAYDLEHQEVLDNLTEYSYESLAEGYFGVKTESSYAEMQMETFKKLLAKEELTDADRVEIRQLRSDFEKIAEAVSPLIVGEYRQMVIQYAEKLKSI